MLVSGTRAFRLQEPLRCKISRLRCLTCRALARPAAERQRPQGLQKGASYQVPSQGGLSTQYQLIGATALAFVLGNMDKVNMSVAIIPMSLDCGWSAATAGLVQASFFWGYTLAQLPSGFLATKLGGSRVLPAGVALWSAATCAVPPLSSTVIGLCTARAAVGLGEAVAPTAAIDMVANAVPAPERSRAVSFIFGGLHVGSILGLLACPWLIHNWGWQSVFFSFGASGLLWAAWFQWLRGSWQRHDPQFAALLKDNGPAVATQAAHSAEQAGRTRSAEAQPARPAAAGLAAQPIPYRAFLRSRPVQALGVTHFCHNFLHYTMLAWLPTYFTSTLAVDLAHAAQTALLPPLAGIIASATAGPLADWLISRGLPVPRVRKAIQGTSFLAPLALLLLACTEHVVHDRTASVACITAALGLSSFSLAGLYCTPQDLSPKYASALLSMSNTAGALPGVIGVTLVGMLYDATQSWQVALFMPSAVFMVIGAYAYCVHCRNTYIDFDDQDNSQFPVEVLFNRLTGRG